MKFSLPSGLILLVCQIVAHASAQAGVYQGYAVAGAQKSWSELPNKVNDTGATLAAGWWLTPAWRFELSAEQLAGKTRGDLSLPLADVEIKALSLSVLGFTEWSGPTQLYYRLGVSRSALDYQQPVVEATVVNPDGSTSTTIRYQDVSRDLIQLQLGLGVEHQFNERWFSRAEWVHQLKQDEFAADSVRLGIGYRF
jgi:opacity protein-like surface antigen